jgi:signal transduction histidine kinase/DNA-binding response OmpR family regulator/ligand-binding sensor domain-containing protein
MRSYFVVLFFLGHFLAIFPAHFKHIGMGEGLSHPSVMSIHQDILGRMWFGTREGITIYDGNSTLVYKPWSDQEDRGHMEALYGNECDFIRGNREGDVFFKTSNALMRYDIREQEFRVVRSNGVRTLSTHDGDIWCMVEDSIFTYDAAGDSLQFRVKTGIHSVFTLLVLSEDKIWLGATHGLYLMEGGAPPRAVIPDKNIYSVFVSSTKDTWVGTRMDGLYRIAPDGTITSYREDTPLGTRVASNQIREFVEDNYGNLWFGTFKGLQKFNLHTEELSLFTRTNLPGGLTHSSVFSLFLDRQETLWAGTYYGGVNYFNPERDIFSHYVDNPNRDDCLNYPFVGNMVEDKNGDIWICTEGGGLNLLDRETRTFRYFVSEDKNGPPHDNLKSISYDEERDMLYIGTHTGGLTRFHIPTRRFHHYTRQPDDSPYLQPNEFIYHTEIYNGHLYVSARNGLFRMDLETGEFTYLKQYCVHFFIDSKGYLWYSFLGNLLRVNTNDPSEVKEISLRARGIRFDATRIIEYDGNIYFGTRGSGLYRYNDADDILTAYTVSKGHLLSNYCYNLALTKSGNLLITGDKGITFFNPRQETSRFVNLGVTLPIASITEGCGVLICRNDEIFVGGSDGLTSFWESELYLGKKEYALYFSDIYIHNQKIVPKDPTGILSEGLPFTNKIKLAHDQNNIVVNFASTNHVDIQRNNEYQYILEGFDDRWNPTSLHDIYYTNLNPGSYRLVIREKISAFDIPGAGEISLHIHISRPWYNTIWAWMAYLLIAYVTLAFFIRVRNSRRALALSLEREQQENERNEKLTQAKIRFFTNISHEFRVPLTLIISQIDLLSQSTSLSPTVYNKILKISNNANRMRGLITELLEFRKLEQHFVSLRVSEQDLVPFLKDIYLSFRELAMQKRVTYQVTPSEKAIPLWFDAYQLQKVFFNLISNAFKFTRDGGTISLVIKDTGDAVVVQVVDNGIGLSPEESRRVFDLFYQAENDSSSPGANSGTGIGLTLSNHIVQLHGGEITVQSERGYGTIFSVKLLKGVSHFENNDKAVLVEAPEEVTLQQGTLPEPLTEKDYEEIAKTFPEAEEGKKQTVLLVEDNEELLQVLYTLFAPLYRVLRARDGKQGLEMAMKEKPDLIVSDVMMPRMTGTEMCMHIKNNIDLSHIPVVLLTALDNVEQKIEGLQQGADDYIGKPFHSKTLLVRCNNIIRNRMLMQRRLTEHPDVDLSSLALNSLDQNLLKRINQVIDQHLHDPEFDVDKLAADAGVSRSSLFTKFKALTGITPNDYIRNKRLKRAAVLLRDQPELRVVEIAEQLGFGSPVYFSRIFKARYGVSPAQYRKER